MRQANALFDGPPGGSAGGRAGRGPPHEPAVVAQLLPGAPWRRWEVRVGGAVTASAGDLDEPPAYPHP
jgi:hypothetical protein